MGRSAASLVGHLCPSLPIQDTPLPPSPWMWPLFVRNSCLLRVMERGFWYQALGAGNANTQGGCCHIWGLAHTQEVLETQGRKLMGRGRDGAFGRSQFTPGHWGRVALLEANSAAFTSLSLSNLESMSQIINIFIIKMRRVRIVLRC